MVGRRKCEGILCNNALHVIGLYGPGDKISVILKDWELAKVALSCHMALEVLCQEMNEAFWSAAERPFVTARKAFLSPRTGCDKNGEGCGERMKDKERER